MKKRVELYLPICLLLVVLAPVAWFFYPSGPNLANAALAEFKIDNLSCGSCVSNIQSALSKVSGVGDVEVNLTSNRGRVFYDPQKIDSQKIAETITAAGYPASVRLELDPLEYQAMLKQQEQLGQAYMAKIGDRLFSRADFEALLQQRSAGAVPQGQEDRLWQSVWQDVLQHELLLTAAEKSQVVVQPYEVEAKLEELQQGHEGLEALVVKRYGSMDAFRSRLREDMIIKRTIEDHVYAGSNDPQERQAKLQSWFADLQRNTEVVIFDKRLKAVTQGGGGCGGGCCGQQG
jgi:copper chaperone CopZ